MIIRTGEATDIPILLVDTNLVGLEELTGITVLLSFQGGGFEPGVAQVTEIGNGWYMYPVLEEEAGMLIIEASHPDATHDWRDIHQVMEPVDIELMLVARPVRNGAAT